MDRWASQMPSVAFICICCAEPALAFAFRDRLRLQSCHNCFLGSDDSLPTWGQLGCSGFVILDSELRVSCPATAAFLDVQGAAFRDVEAKLRALLLLPDGDAAEASVPDDDSNADEDGVAGQRNQSSGGSCASGRCSLPTSGGGSCCEKTECGCVVDPLGDIQPTGVAAMDQEHEECARVLGELRDKRSLEALASVLRCLESHFAHEEQMLDESLYASAAPSSAVGTKRKSVGDGDAMGGEEKGAKGFSAEAGARKSHYADHARMLRAVKGCLDDARDAPERLATDAFVDGLLRDFEAHASRYDDAYRVPAGAAALEGEAASLGAESS